MKKIREAVRERGVLMVPALWRCHCGETLECEAFTNTCEKCGTDYNWSGQALAPRSQWGEETGESLSDIMMADSDPFGGDY